MEKIKVLFVCIHNSSRSQMAEAFLNELGKERFLAESAGIEPSSLNQYTVNAMSEIGYDISNNRTRSVFDILKTGKIYDYVITVCDPEAAERDPLFPGKSIKLHCDFKDPSAFQGTDKEKLDFTRSIRDEIKEKIMQFIKNIQE